MHESSFTTSLITAAQAGTWTCIRPVSHAVLMFGSFDHLRLYSYRPTRSTSILETGGQRFLNPVLCESLPRRGLLCGSLLLSDCIFAVPSKSFGAFTIVLALTFDRRRRWIQY